MLAPDERVSEPIAAGNLSLTMAGHDRPHGMVGIRRRAERNRGVVQAGTQELTNRRSTDRRVRLAFWANALRISTWRRDLAHDVAASEIDPPATFP